MAGRDARRRLSGAQCPRLARFAEQFKKLSADQRQRLTEASGLHRKCAEQYHASNYSQRSNLVSNARSAAQDPGADATDTAVSLNLLGLVYTSRHEYAQGEQVLAEAVKIWQAAGEKHPEYAVTVQNLADLYIEAEKYDQANQLSRQALAIRRDCYGTEDSDARYSADELSTILAALADKQGEAGNFAAAKPFRDEVVELRSLYKGPEHWQTHEAMWRQKFDEARATLTVETQQQLKDAEAMQTQAGQFAAAKQYGPAIAAIEETVRLHGLVFGEKSLTVAQDLNQAASFNALQNNVTRANELYGQVRDIVKVELGPDHPFYANMLSRLGQGGPRQQKNLPLAADLYRESWQTFNRAYGANSQSTQEAVKQLLEVLGLLATAQETKPDLPAAKKSRRDVGSADATLRRKELSGE